MAVPSNPTLAEIAAEAIKSAGYRSGTTEYSLLVSRAQTEWAEEIKMDIYERVKSARMLMTEGLVILSTGDSRYSFPSDFSSLVSASLLSGANSGTAQAGSASTITLSASESLTSTETLGKTIVLTGGTGSSQESQITSYNTTTKVAGVSPSWATNPDGTTTYLVASMERELTSKPIDQLTKEEFPFTKGEPLYIFPTGGSTVQGLEVYPVPDQAYAIKLRYYADLQLVDTTSTILSTLYRKWRNVFLQGIYVKALRHQKDEQAYSLEIQVYAQRLRNLVARESYGTDLRDLHATVVDRNF